MEWLGEKKDHLYVGAINNNHAHEDDLECIVCEKELSESNFTKDDEMCDPCYLSHGICSVCQDVELRTDLHLDSTGMMKLCARCEKYDAGAESFESTPYNNYFGACLSPEGDCFETSLETCRAIGGRFQGPGTSCGGYQSPVMMRSETTETKGKGNGIWLAITVGVMTGVATTIFGNVLSEMWLDRLREDPELHTTPDDLEPPV